MYGLNPSGQVLELPLRTEAGLDLKQLRDNKTVEAGACMGGATYQADSEQVSCYFCQ